MSQCDESQNLQPVSPVIGWHPSPLESQHEGSPLLISAANGSLSSARSVDGETRFAFVSQEGQ